MQNLTEDEEIALALAMSAEAAHGSGREPYVPDEQPHPSVPHEAQPAGDVPVAQSTDSAAVEAALPSRVGLLAAEEKFQTRTCLGMDRHAMVLDRFMAVCGPRKVLLKVDLNLPPICIVEAQQFRARVHVQQTCLQLEQINPVTAYCRLRGVQFAAQIHLEAGLCEEYRLALC